jgi:hypothetical protein
MDDIIKRLDEQDRKLDAIYASARRESRARVVVADLSDDDIDRLIKQAQKRSRAAGWRGWFSIRTSLSVRP